VSLLVHRQLPSTEAAALIDLTREIAREAGTRNVMVLMRK